MLKSPAMAVAYIRNALSSTDPEPTLQKLLQTAKLSPAHRDLRASAGLALQPTGHPRVPAQASTAARTRRQNVRPFSGRCQRAEVTARPRKMLQPKCVWEMVTQDSELLRLPLPPRVQGNRPANRSGQPC